MLTLVWHFTDVSLMIIPVCVCVCTCVCVLCVVVVLEHLMLDMQF